MKYSVASIGNRADHMEERISKLQDRNLEMKRKEKQILKNKKF